MDISLSTLACGFIFGVIGIAVFRRGKSRGSALLLTLGIALMVYPYFVTDAVWAWVTGFLLCAAVYRFWQS